ncbi:MAG: CHAT domain-containing protein [Blastocatellia bacterium]
MAARPVSASARIAQDVRLLELGKPIEREIARSQTHYYRIMIAAGQYLHVMVEQRSSNVVVAISGPDGRPLAESDFFRRGAESLHWIARTSGAHMITVRAIEARAATGHYAVGIAELRTATEADQSSVAAEQAFRAGEQLSRQATAESSRSAIEKYEEALRFWQTTGDQRGAALALTRLGLTYDGLKEKQKALDHYQQALAFWRAVDDRRMVGATLANIGMIHLVALRPKEGLDNLQQALPFVRAGDDRSLEAATLTSIGGAYFFSDAERSLEYLDQALTLWYELKDRFGEAQALRLVGAANYRLGKKELAAEYFKRANQILQTGVTPPGEATPEEKKRFAAARAMSEAEVLAAGGAGDALRQALEKYQESLELWLAVPDRAMAAHILTRISSAHLLLGEKQEAVGYLDQVLAIRRAMDDHYGEALALSTLAETHYSLGEKRLARDYLNQAIPLWREVGDQHGEAEALYLSARAAYDGGALKEARAHIEAALAIIESLRAGIANPEWRATYYGSKQAYYDLYIDLLMQSGRQSSSTEQQAAAIHASERARARSLLDLLAEARIDIRGGSAPVLLERERTLQQRINAQDRYRLQLLGNDPNSKLAAEIGKELEALLARYQEVRSQIRQGIPHHAALTQPQPLSLAEIQQQVLDDDTLLLEYALGDERSYLWAVTPASIHSFELPKRTEVKAAALRVQSLLTARHQPANEETAAQRQLRLAQADAQYPEAAAALSRMLLGPVAAQLGKKRLLIVADGVLLYIPFGALPKPSAGSQPTDQAQPLIIDHEIVNLPSASTLAVLRRELAGRSPAPQQVAVLADPVFELDDSRVKPNISRVPAASAGLSVLSRAALAGESGVAKSAKETRATDGAGRLQRLLFSRKEADEILSLVPGGAGLKALDFAASRATATSDELSRYRIVHFSTHSLLNSLHPELSGIVFSLVDKQGQGQDGFLRLHDIYNLKLPADLVVLSACQTGLGQEIQGEGLIGLTRGFMHAGAPRVVASLWKVDDRASAELMKHFYREMLKEKQRPAAALRAAQVAMWKQRRWQSPFYWAAFTIQGEWR